MGEMAKRSKKGGRERKPSAVSVRKPSRDERLNTTVQNAKAYYLWYEKQLKNIEVAASVIPVVAADELVQFADQQRRLYARYVRLRFGVEIQSTQDDTRALVIEISGDTLRFLGRGDYKPVADLSLVRPERWPHNLREEALLDGLIWKYEIADFTQQAMIDVGWDVKEAGRGVENMAWAMCQVFLRIYRGHFILSGISMHQSSELPPSLREMHTALLAGWTGSKVSLKRNRRLSAALVEGGTIPAKALPRELLAATFVEWPASPHEGSVKDFVNRVTRSLERMGREATIRPEKVRDAPPGEAGRTIGFSEILAEDEDLTKFEREETLRQQRQQLDILEQVARLSPQQTEVWRRRYKGMEIAEIAAELGISENQVSVQNHNALKKLSAARKAAGF